MRLHRKYNLITCTQINHIKWRYTRNYLNLNVNTSQACVAHSALTFDAQINIMDRSPSPASLLYGRTIAVYNPSSVVFIDTMLSALHVLFFCCIIRSPVMGRPVPTPVVRSDFLSPRRETGVGCSAGTSLRRARLDGLISAP